MRTWPDLIFLLKEHWQVYDFCLVKRNYHENNNKNVANGCGIDEFIIPEQTTLEYEMNVGEICFFIFGKISTQNGMFCSLL